VRSRLALLVGLLAAVTLALAAPAASLAVTPRTSLNDVEDEVMCVSCGIPLNIADSPQADRERAFINDHIALGKSKAQIKQLMVAEYGNRVIAQPNSKGFNITNWLIPLVVVVALIAGVAIVLPRWRRAEISAELAGDDPADVPELDDEERRRIDEDLARYR
jgi:cytochrome c-type biogenesis protein CcmH/NrfF